MAKDPAFLFYPGDYVTGTMHLDFECKGAYMDLLMLQFQKEHMSLHMIKQVLGDKYEHIWSHISDKFETNGKFFWNGRLKYEKEKRANFCKSRKKNRNSHKKEPLHMSQHMEDVNILRVIGDIEKEENRVFTQEQKELFMYLIQEMVKVFLEKNPEYFFDQEQDCHACLQIAYKIAVMKKWSKYDVLNGKMEDCLGSWRTIVDFIMQDNWFSQRSLSDICTVKEWQRLVGKMSQENKKQPTKTDYQNQLDADRKAALKSSQEKNI